MASAKCMEPRVDQTTPLTGHLDSLAYTCSQAGQPIWVQDAQGYCVLANSPAQTRSAPPADGAAFEILDHHGQVIGRLLLAAA